ncbi:hypothetical protein JMUB5695_00078 [Mycobacterium heckeshornense]|uniref:Uncharacterized protein n=1 Tax=Mycobacterium heckeshornense TaxID=110505 RepID=A0A7R7TR28_9MYCO|nr:hypothetical protein MHEC_00800 [Mycobacterium heckeshornense]BCQ06669.1 hypothetical protein JMUB5695_00078 [Mycobacterium heckeshornense]
MSDGQRGRFATCAADGVAVHDEVVRYQLRAGARVLGALRSAQAMTNDGAVAVIQASLAVAAAGVHGPFLALWADKSVAATPENRDLSPSQFV